MDELVAKYLIKRLMQILNIKIKELDTCKWKMGPVVVYDGPYFQMVCGCGREEIPLCKLDTITESFPFVYVYCNYIRDLNCYIGQCEKCLTTYLCPKPE